MKTGYTFNNGGTVTDFGDVFIPKSLFVPGGLWLWGYNSDGQLGNNNIVNNSSPIQTISGGTNWKLVTCGGYHTAAIKADGTLWSWGRNTSGQLGDNTLISKSSPIQTISGGTNWKTVACGGFHTTAIKTDGTLWSWGLNTSGQLGNNTAVGKSSPIQTISGGTNWRSISCGVGHTAAIKTDGTLWLWGSNAQGQLGDNTVLNKSSPIQTISVGTDWKSVSCGFYHTAAIKTDGTLWLWGYNNYGQLGNNVTTYRSSPVQTIAGGTNWKSVVCGAYHTAAIKTDGTLWLWGQNNYGGLGDNTLSNRSSPVQTVSGGTDWKLVACGTSYNAAIKTDGTLWTWGYNLYGQLGDNTIANESSPVQTVSGGTNWRGVACWQHHTVATQY